MFLSLHTVTDKQPLTKVFAKAGLNNVTSAMCYYQQRFRLDVQYSALVLNFNNIFSTGHLYRAGQSMNSLPSQILERCTQPFRHTLITQTNCISKTADMNTSKDFKLNNRTIVITTPVDEFDNNKIYTSRYFFQQVNGQKREMLAKAPKTAFYRDVEIQLEAIEGKAITERVFFEALLRGCEKHIEKFGRLIITDLHTQLNVTMHLVDATNGIFHTIINNEDDGISLRNYYTGGAFEMMPDHILVPHPSMTDENGRPKLITIRQAKSNA